MSIERKFKTALDETRLLMLGSQIFFGFQFNSTFQPVFESLPPRVRWLDAAALLLMTVTIACLIATSARHRIADRGHLDHGTLRAAGIFTGIALFPFSLSLAVDIYIVTIRIFDERIGLLAAAFCWVMAATFWYVLEMFCRDTVLWNTAMSHASSKQTALPVRIEQMLTEARVALPGAQALLGFQLLAVLTQSFERLPRESQLLHAGALACVALTVIFLVAPAAFHRIAFNGADSERFYRIGSRLVSVALFPLALGMAGDVYVAIAKLTDPSSGAIAAVGTLLLLLVLWYFYPLFLRGTKKSSN